MDGGSSPWLTFRFFFSPAACMWDRGLWCVMGLCLHHRRCAWTCIDQGQARPWWAPSLSKRLRGQTMGHAGHEDRIKTSRSRSRSRLWWLWGGIFLLWGGGRGVVRGGGDSSTVGISSTRRRNPPESPLSTHFSNRVHGEVQNPWYPLTTTCHVDLPLICFFNPSVGLLRCLTWRWRWGVRVRVRDEVRWDEERALMISNQVLKCFKVVWWEGVVSRPHVANELNFMKPYNISLPCTSWWRPLTLISPS